LSRSPALPIICVNSIGTIHALSSWRRQSIQFAESAAYSPLIPDLGRAIKEIEVACITFEEVIERLPSPKLDLLQIDAEGADGLVLSLFPFETLRPIIVHWERKNLMRSEQESALDFVGSLVTASGHRARLCESN
jgi:hypothetical protein